MKVNVLLIISAVLLLGLAIWCYQQAPIRHTLLSSTHGVCRVVDGSKNQVQMISPTTGESQVYRVSIAYVNLCTRSMTNNIPITVYREITVQPYYCFFISLTVLFLILLGGVFVLLIRRI